MSALCRIAGVALDLESLIACGLLIPEGRWFRVPAYLELPEDVRARAIGIKRSESATWVQFAEQQKRRGRT